LKKELIIFIGIFLFLAIGMHFNQWLSHPVEHVMAMSSGGAFGIPGIVHPFVFTLIVYIIVRLPVFVIRLFSKKKKTPLE